MTFRADLHTHTTCSDGSLSPVELIELAKKQGLQGLSITDHDSIAAYQTAIPEAKRQGILLGAGVEFSADYQGMSVHILGYDFSLENPEIHSFCAAHQKRRQKRNHAILEKLKKMNMPIEESELEAFNANAIGRPHIAHLMVAKKYVASEREAFNIYLAEGKCCYDPGDPFSAQQTIDLLHAAGGKAFIAHPHLSDDRKLLRELIKLNFDGIECYYAKCNPDKERQFLKIAKERNFKISGGSDFHGALKPHIPLGCSWVDETHFHQIFQHPL